MYIGKTNNKIHINILRAFQSLDFNQQAIQEEVLPLSPVNLTMVLGFLPEVLPLSLCSYQCFIYTATYRFGCRKILLVTIMKSFLFLEFIQSQRGTLLQLLKQLQHKDVYPGELVQILLLPLTLNAPPCLLLHTKVHQRQLNFF